MPTPENVSDSTIEACNTLARSIKHGADLDHFPRGTRPTLLWRGGKYPSAIRDLVNEYDPHGIHEGIAVCLGESTPCQDYNLKAREIDVEGLAYTWYEIFYFG